MERKRERADVIDLNSRRKKSNERPVALKQQEAAVEEREPTEKLPEDERKRLETTYRLTIALLKPEIGKRFPGLNPLFMHDSRNKVFNDTARNELNKAVLARNIDEEKFKIRESYDDEHLMQELARLKDNKEMLAARPAYYIAIMDVIEQRILLALKDNP